METKPSESEAMPGRQVRRLPWIVKFIFWGGLAFGLAVLLGLGIPIARELTRPLKPPTFDHAAEGLLVLAAQSGNTAAPLVNDRMTSFAATFSASTPGQSSETLRFKPFIPDTPYLTKRLKENRQRLNARFDEILRRIAQYEAEKDKLGPQKAMSTVIYIGRDYGEIWKGIEKLGRERRYGLRTPYDEMDRRDDEFWQWSIVAELEYFDKLHDVKNAAERATHLRLHNMTMWINEHTMMDSMSGYFDGQGVSDYEWEIYYWRQVGGYKGFTGIISTVVDHQLFRFGNKMKSIVLHYQYPTLEKSRNGSGNSAKRKD